MRLKIRRATPSDTEAIARIQAVCLEAAHWEPASYLDYDCRISETDGTVCGFVVAQRLAGDEMEILNLAVAPEFRRQGIGRALLASLISNWSGDLFLEVRESNLGAREFYAKLGFHEAGRRQNYYQDDLETAVVLRFRSC